MTTTTITITGNTQTLSGDVYYDPIVIKGRNMVNFDFTSLDTTDNTILRVKTDYGDGSQIEYTVFSIGLDHATQPITYYFALYGTYSPLLVKSHLYESPSENTYFNALTAKFYIELADSRLLNFYFPIKIAQPSFYQEMGRINIASTQLVSVCSNDVFCAIHDKTGDVINIILS